MFFHLVGFVGMSMVVYAFHMVVSGKWTTDSKRYLMNNLIGAILLFISLIFHFNLGSLVIEIFWIYISIKGLYKLKSNK